MLTGRVSTNHRGAIGEDGNTTTSSRGMQKGRMWQMALHSGHWREGELTFKHRHTLRAPAPFYALYNSYSTATIADLFRQDRGRAPASLSLR